MALDLSELELGTYSLFTVDNVDRRSRSKSVRLTVGEEVRAIAAAAATGPVLPFGSEVDRSGDEFSAEAAQAFRAGLRDSMHLLASGSAAASDRQLQDMEVEFLASFGPEALTELAKLEIEMAKSLGSRRPVSVVALFVQRQRLYRAYRQEKAYILSGFSQRLAFQQFEIYFKNESFVNRRKVGADLLASLGGDLQRGRAQRP